MNAKYNFHSDIIEYFFGLTLHQEITTRLNLNQNHTWSRYKYEAISQEISRLIFGKTQYFVAGWKKMRLPKILWAEL